MKNILMGILLSLAVGACLPAQEEGYSMAYGSSSIQYNASTGYVTTYSETDLDPNFAGSYQPLIFAQIQDQNGVYFMDSTDPRCTASGDGVTFAGVTCVFAGQPNQTYTLTSHHELTVTNEIQQHDPCATCGGGIQYYYTYDDYDDFASLGDYGIDDPFGVEFVPPYINNPTYANSIIGLGDTYDRTYTSPPVACGDVRDQQIQEYRANFASWIPLCTDFSWIDSWTYPGSFSFQTLTPDESTGGGQFAILQTYMANQLRLVFNQLTTGIPNINSGYRNPAAEKAAATKNHVKYYGSSRHMAGDAVDLQAGNQTIYTDQASAAHNHAACVEPVSTQRNYGHTHADWRLLAPSGTTFYWGSANKCPNGW